MLTDERSSVDALLAAVVEREGERAGDASARPRRGRLRRAFTPTQEMILRYLAGETVLHGGVCCSKRDLASRLDCNVKTIDRCLSDLRKRGLVSAEMRFDEHGAQVPSLYRVVLEGAPSG